MATNLNLWNDNDNISAYFGLDETLILTRSNPLTQSRLLEIRKDAEDALVRGILPEVGRPDWRELVRVGSTIGGALPVSIKRELDVVRDGSFRPRKAPGRNERQDDQVEIAPSLILHLRGDVISIPWEIIVMGGADEKGERLLGEVFDVGRRIITLPGQNDEVVYAPMPFTTDTVRILIVVDNAIDDGAAKEEGRRLMEKFRNGRSAGLKIEFTYADGITGRELFRELPSHHILHFAGEAEPGDARTPDRTAWRLSRNEWLDPEAIKREPVASWPFLVFANGCGTSYFGDDSMARALLMRGVMNYISAFARIPNGPIVVDLASLFYDALLAGQTVGQALRNARRMVSEDESGRVDYHSRIVAANYVHYGNPDKRFFAPPRKAAAKRRFYEPADEDSRSQPDEAPELMAAPNVTIERVIRNISDARSTKRIGPYECLKEIGHGSYRVVHLAQSFNPDVPEKEVILALPYNQHADFARRQREAFLLLQPKLEKHPGLVRIYDVAGRDRQADDQRFYVVYEMARGVTLEEKMAETSDPMDVDEACQLVEKVAEILGAAHDLGMAHGELTPREIVVAPDGGIKILDVGRLAVLRQVDVRSGLAESSEPYRAPEQWLAGWRVDAPCDLWALAVIAYRLLTNAFPFSRGENETWSDAILHSAPYPPILHRPDLPEGIANFFLRAFSRASEERYRSASEFLQALDQARQGRSRVGGFTPDLERAISAGMPLLLAQSEDEVNVLARLQAVAEGFGRPFYTWRLTTGLTRGADPEAESLGCVNDPLSVLDWLSNVNEPAILALLDYDAYFDDMPAAADPVENFREVHGGASHNPPPHHDTRMWDRNDALSRAFAYDEQRDSPRQLTVFGKEQIHRRLESLAFMLRDDPAPARTAIIVAPAVAIPHELEKTVHLFHFQPVRAAEVRELLRQAATIDGQPESEWLDEFALHFAWHAGGLSASEIGDSLRLSVTRHGSLLPEECLADLHREKEQIVRRQGMLELTHPSVTLDDVTGLDHLKDWFEPRITALTDPASAFYMPPPRGVLLGGMPGCGKSLCAQAMAGSLGWPLLRLDVGHIFGGLLGLSEQNIHSALTLAEELSPAVLWIDEIEKGFGQTSGAGASSTGMRVFQIFLTWLQERSHCVFLVATANEEGALPSELLRAGRFDECFFLDWPNQREREALLKQYLENYGRDTTGHDFAGLARLTGGYSSAELAGRVINALYNAARRRQVNPSPEELREALAARPRPLSHRPGQKRRLEALRALWTSFARPASYSITDAANLY